MKKLLILTDLTEESVNTYRYGCQLALATGAEIILMHAPGEATFTITRQLAFVQKLRSFADRYALPAGARTDKQNTPKTECLVTAGDPLKTLAEVVQAWHPDLLVAGESFLQLLHGDQPQPLDELVACPVILVPNGAVFKPIREIVFATDFSDQDVTVAQGVCNLAASLFAHISFVHFYPKSDRNRRANLTFRAEDLIRNLDACDTSFTLIEEEDLLEGLNDFAEKNPADLFVLATQDTHLLQQYFRQTYRKTQAYHTQVPLLNLYQERTSPCSAGCTHCHSKTTETSSPEVAGSVH